MIRDLTVDDLRDVKDLFFNSFTEEEALTTYPVISQIITKSPKIMSLCLGWEEEKRIVGAIAFTPVFFDSSSAISAYILAPLAVHNTYQKNGIATNLINKAKKDLSDKGIDALLVYGDPSYYGKHGFEVELGKHFIPPYKPEYEFGWQALMLSSTQIENAEFHFTCVEALSDATLW